MTKRIIIRNSEDIQSINKICTQYRFDIGLHCKDGVADAKSLLGMFLLSLNQPTYIVVDDDIDVSHLWKELSDFIVDEEDE